ncbi:cytochrome ubiquinol oxidase subunit I [Halodesulfovibrio marinisediminis]|uniref:Cytochrome bd-I ubiquinol oxidase subunit 1 apoprotein n=1 Tax=Halodesulfovibrio marinisediminis DSM 17456 TaxID=1121457 RepID=A0A1N6F7T6_9BACT|nr:cytochrome ubiquinol oxidase subunit I [Halodesulfovibrio marinisediminis]SIN91276.1 cytochrome bd-I ubiquinol oxidase subunit 1 apoprotein [Halodesulfovibrio marinisediminis DSM 17456]
MEYPVWWLPSVSGGLLIACISIIHVFIAHFAVGGGFFLVLTERKGYAEDNPHIVEYVKRHTKFFLLLTMVAGGLTGVGIWFTISLVSPAATSVLVRRFGFGWATEWVFFLCEIVALLIYHYRFGKMSRRDHQIIGWLYALFAFLSLFVVNGIITMMLTPGNWLETKAFWDGFWNPTFWPSLWLRFSICLMFAGLFALVTAYRIEDEKTREQMIRYAVRFVAYPFALLVACAVWYVFALPEAQLSMVLKKSAQTPQLVEIFLPLSAVLLVGVLTFAYVTPQAVRPVLLAVLLVVGIGQIGTFEWIREAGRRPYIIYGYMWSNSVLVEQTEDIRKNGMLAYAKWSNIREINEDNLLKAGEDLYRIQCLGCHGLSGPMFAAEKVAAGLTREGLMAQFNGQGKLREFMPPFLGNDAERKAVSAYLAHAMNKSLEEEPAKQPQIEDVTLPAFNLEDSEYVLVAWGTEGVNTISDNYSNFTMQIPGSTIRAQLFLRDEVPEIVTEDVVLTYRIEKAFSTPAEHVTFWHYANQLTGKDLPPDTGICDINLIGTFKLDEENRAFVACSLPIFPYSNSGTVNPYPLLNVEARTADGKLLAATKVAVPISTEWGCRNCHDGSWRVADTAGISNKTADNILAAHDKINGTSLVDKAEHGTPPKCQSCHESSRTGDAGKKEILGFSAAIHGWHANYLTGRDDITCESCHPAAHNTNTQAMRGLHVDRDITCTNCHGTMEDHALGLLKAEKEKGKPRAEFLMTNLTPRVSATFDEVQPREAWTNQPDCGVCHSFSETPDSDASAVNKWTENAQGLFKNRKDDLEAVMCQACHGTAHALYPADNGYGEVRNNITPMQYQKFAAPLGSEGSCICHTMEMSVYDSAHHPIVEK